MSFPGNIQNSVSNPTALLGINQQQPRAQPFVVAQNTLQQSGATNAPILTVSSMLHLREDVTTQAIAQSILAPTPVRPSLQTILNQWTGSDINKIKTTTTISNCIRNRSLILNLSCSSLKSLPEIFDYPELSHLRVLYLINNQLTELPSSIGGLKALEELYLSNNELSELPISIAQLTEVKKLILVDNHLVELPSSIDGLKSLEILNLTNNRLTVLPDSIAGLKALYMLNVANNHLRELPRSMNGLKTLEKLILVNNHLTVLPNSMSGLTALKTLNLINNPLSSLPNFLRALNLKVHDLPFSLNITCITEEICKLANVSTSEALQQLYTNATDSDRRKLRDWLCRLKDTASGKAKDVHFYKSIVHILELASANEAFRTIFWHVLTDAATTCGDRVALSILDLDIARQLISLNLDKHLHVADFLKRGVWTYNLLKEHAINKSLELRAANRTFDEIEVHLGYFIKLKEPLKLPITIEEMLYFACSTLTALDLEIAKAHILKELANQESFIAFLIEQDTWKKNLKTKHPKKFEAIQKAYIDSEEDPGNAIATYQTALKNLTKKLLQEPEIKAKRSRVGARELASIGINLNSKDLLEDEKNPCHKPVTRIFKKS
ncbi:MAG: NEL-type E3 ubiquitin ligase domain-containing protein [Chlamydiota bacterium]